MRQVILGALLGLSLSVGLYPQSRLGPPNDPNASAREGESEILINTAEAGRDIAVWVNNAIAAHIAPKTTEKIIVRNGKYIIEVAETTPRRNQWNIGARKQVVVDLSSNRLTLGLLIRYGRLLDLNILQTESLQTRRAGSPQPQRDTGSSGGIEDAVYRAAQTLVDDLPAGATVAIISISSSDGEIAEFVLEELAYLLVETKKFRIVDRKSLDAIKSEHYFQSSGEVDDNSAVSIGKMLGASIVITGSISGSGSTRRLRSKALDVKTAEIVAMTSEPF
ncbi:MAG: CsgG/HfaB family protein [Treponema sp.]|nr:CsgG/HfaB family protein [Treponema sp.]